jgi:membrane dipeptidase
LLIADAHCDTIAKIFHNGEKLFENSGHVDIKRLIMQNVKLQFFAVFVEGENKFSQTVNIINRFHEECANNFEHIAKIRSVADYDENKINALLTVEGGASLEGEIENVQLFWDMGVRLMTLTWNGKNELANGILQDGETDEGLTDFGREVAKEMMRLGMIIDVSHIAERGFWDVMEFTEETQPIFASHSNAKEICNHPRNLTDEQIKAIINCDGFIGLNFYPDFLGNNSIEGILRHVEHILKLGGENVLGFGADFDGVDKLPEEINGAEDYPLVIEKMVKTFGEKTTRKIAGENLFGKIKSL